MLTRLAAICAVAIAVSGCARDRALVIHHFDASAEGWLVAGDTGTAAAGFQSDGSGSGGYIFGDDEALGETWYFRAPDTVLSQLPAAEGGMLSYRLKQSSAQEGFLDDDIVIVGPAGRLSYRFEHAPGTGWTDFSVRLSASEDWRWNWNARATEEQIRSVLRDPSRLEIRGEYQTGPDVGGLDDFVLTARR